MKKFLYCGPWKYREEYSEIYPRHNIGFKFWMPYSSTKKFLTLKPGKLGGIRNSFKVTRAGV